MNMRENLETYVVNGEMVGCGSCLDKYICGGCRVRAYGYFNGDVNASDTGCICNKALWEKLTGTE